MALIRSYLRASRTLFVSDQGKSGESILSIVKPGGGVAAELVVGRGISWRSESRGAHAIPRGYANMRLKLKETDTTKQNADSISLESFVWFRRPALTSVRPGKARL